VSAVDLSENTTKRLLGLIESFDDTPDTIIQRLLDFYEATSSRDKLKISSDPPKEGDLLPEGKYWIPILEILEDAGWAARGSDVIDALGEKLHGQFRARDHDLLKMGEVRWRNRARFARLRMKELGLISSESRRGIWEMTKKGHSYLQAERGFSQGR
jgi:hypothetical protein